jgi:hypothetical protein
MKWPFVSRRRYDDLVGEYDGAVAGEVKAIKAAARAELALKMSFGISVEDVLDKDVKEIKVWVADAVLCHYRGDPREVLRREAHNVLDRIISNEA